MLLYIIAGISLLWAILVYYLSGEKYMKWYYRYTGKDYREFDPKKFRLAHGGSLALFCVIALLAQFVGKRWILYILCFAPVIVNYLLILTWCKKKG